MISAEQARRIRLLGLDVDGVLTDNGIWIAPVNEERVEFKRFDISDGLGLVIMRYSDLEVAWVSGRHSEATTLRARELRIATVLQVSKAAKLPAVTELLEQRGLGWDQFAFMGDDLADLPLLRRAGLAITVANGCPEVKAAAHWVTTRPGGQGAVREAIEGILRARNEWDDAVERYLGERGETK